MLITHDPCLRSPSPRIIDGSVHSTCGESGLGLSGAAKLPPAAADDRPPHGESQAEAEETEGGRTQAGELAADDDGVPPLQAQEETVRGMPLGEVVSEPLGDVRCDSCEGEGGKRGSGRGNGAVSHGRARASHLRRARAGREARRALVAVAVLGVLRCVGQKDVEAEEADELLGGGAVAVEELVQEAL